MNNTTTVILYFTNGHNFDILKYIKYLLWLAENQDTNSFSFFFEEHHKKKKSNMY